MLYPGHGRHMTVFLGLNAMKNPNFGQCSGGSRGGADDFPPVLSRARKFRRGAQISAPRPNFGQGGSRLVRGQSGGVVKVTMAEKSMDLTDCTQLTI